MHICLITPPSPFLLDERVFPALGILKVAAILEQAGHQVDHLDLCGVRNYEKAVADYPGAEIYGVTATTPQMPAALHVLRAIHSHGAAGKTILGGPHPTLVHAAAKRGNERARKALETLLTAFDVVVTGDGEKAILTALNSQGLVDADDPKSILWNTSKDFEDSPWPSRHLVDMDSYHYRIDGAKATSMIAQLGCLSPDTLIVLSSGYEKPISEIQIGEEVLCFDAEIGEIVSRPVEQTYQREADDIWEIEWGNGQKLRITGEHPIFTREGWQTIQEVEVGGVSAYLRGMRYEFQSPIGSTTRKILQTEMQRRVAKVSSEHGMAIGGASKDEGAVCIHDGGSEAAILHSRTQQLPPNTDCGNSREVVIHKARPPKPNETPRSSGESFSHNQKEVGQVLFGSDERRLGEREIVIRSTRQTLYWSKQEGDSTSRSSFFDPTPVSIRRKWDFLDRSMYFWNETESRLYLQRGEESDPTTWRALALAPRSEEGSSGLPELRMASPCDLVQRTTYKKQGKSDTENIFLWSGIISKRFIGKGTVHNITVHPGHTYFASEMLVHNCPFHCKFCGGRNSPMLRQIRVRPSDSVIEEMMHLHNNYGMTGIMHFQDELNVNHRSLVDLMVKIKDTGIPWQQRGFVKAELFNEEQAEVMYAAGFRWLLCGFEAAHPRILKNIAKNATLEDNTKMLRIAHKHGIKVKALMSVGHPGESEKTILATRDWLLEEKPDDFDVTIITVYPGTPYFDESVCVGEPVYKYVTNGDTLYSESTDFHRDMQYYKGAPHEYKSYVWTDFISREKLCELRDEVEDEARTKLGIPYATGAAAINFEKSMGQGLPSTILRSSQ